MTRDEHHARIRELLPKVTAGEWFIGYWGGQCHKPEHKHGHPGLIGSDPCVYDPVRYEGWGGISSETREPVVSVEFDELLISENNASLIALAPETARHFDAVMQENARLRESLTFYADVSKYPAPLTGGQGELYFDCGQRARAALKETTK